MAPDTNQRYIREHFPTCRALDIRFNFAPFFFLPFPAYFTGRSSWIRWIFGGLCSSSGKKRCGQFRDGRAEKFMKGGRCDCEGGVSPLRAIEAGKSERAGNFDWWLVIAANSIQLDALLIRMLLAKKGLETLGHCLFYKCILLLKEGGKKLLCRESISLTRGKNAICNCDSPAHMPFGPRNSYPSP